MEKKPLITIALATYNAGKYLPLTLKSINNLSWKNLELLAVDNLSSDNTVELLKKSGFKVTEKETGLLEARDIMIREAKGDYIAILDADEIITANIFERSVEIMEKGSYDQLIWEEKSYKPKNLFDWLFYADRKLNHELRNDDAILGMLAPRFFRAKLVKQAYKNIPVKDLKGLLTQDYAILQYELSKLSDRIGYLPKAVEQQEVNEFFYFLRHFYRYGKRAAIIERNPTYVRLYKKVFETKTRFRPFSLKYFWLWVGANILLILKGIPWYLGYRLEKMKDSQTKPVISPLK